MNAQTSIGYDSKLSERYWKRAFRIASFTIVDDEPTVSVTFTLR
jgi:hypothetical protein